MNHTLEIPTLIHHLKNAEPDTVMPLVDLEVKLKNASDGVRHLYDTVLLPFLRNDLHHIRDMDLDRFSAQDMEDLYALYEQTFEPQETERRKQATLYRLCQQAEPIPFSVEFL